nr:maternal effect embryo arrest 59 [Tanacetum cinerariifolium]
MAGTPHVTVKPSRSDEIIHPDEQLLISEQVRSYFESMLPKRPTKPNRSDPDYFVTSEPVDGTIPELIKFQSLVSQSQGIVADHKATPEEEFVETGYYKQLVSIDKEHHTTGNGFIKVAREDNGNYSSYDIRLNTGTNGVYKDLLVKSNPATNDWVPSSGDYYDQDEHMSLKPNRSENW